MKIPKIPAFIFLLSVLEFNLPLSAQSLVGGWYFPDQNTVYTFDQSNTYSLTHDFGPAGGPGIGLEFGTYLWSSSTNTFISPGLIDQTDGADGLFTNVFSPPFSTTTSFSSDGNTLTFNGMVGTRIIDSSNPLVGSWILTNTTASTTSAARAVITFLANGQYYEAQNQFAGDIAGIEHGTYTWNPATGIVSTKRLADTNGEGGLSDPVGSNYKISLVNDLMKLSDSRDLSYLVRAVQPELVLPFPTPASVKGTWTSGAPFFFFNNIPTSAWADPASTNTFYFQTVDNSRFSLIGLPAGSWNTFQIYDGMGNLLGTADPGSFFTFSDPVDSFLISGIDPLVATDDPTGFPVQVFLMDRQEVF